MSDLHDSWRNELVFTVEAICKGLRGTPTVNKLKETQKDLRTALARITLELYHLQALYAGVLAFHLQKNDLPPHDNERIPLPDVIEQDCLHWQRRDHPFWRMADYEQIGRLIAAYKARNPPPAV